MTNIIPKTSFFFISEDFKTDTFMQKTLRHKFFNLLHHFVYATYVRESKKNYPYIFNLSYAIANFLQNRFLFNQQKS